MPAPKGNRFWEARTKHGRNKLFASADALKEACIEYFEWVEDNPLWEAKVTQYQGAPVEMIIPKMRAMTIEGLCIFLDMSTRNWRDWREDEDFSPVVEWAEEVIRSQKFSGAAADLLNPNIIARDLGLKDHSTQEVNVHNYDGLDDDELNRKLAEKRQLQKQSEIH